MARFLLFFVAIVASRKVTLDVEWSSYLSRHDLMWFWKWGSTRGSESNFIPTTWNTAAYVGNGLVGVSVRSVEGQEGAIRMDVGRTDLWDKNSRNRLPVGFFLLSTHSPGFQASMRQKLYEAELEGYIMTEDNSNVSFQLFANGADLDNSVIVLVINSTSQEKFSLVWYPEMDGLQKNPSPKQMESDQMNINVTMHPLNSGGCYATAVLNSTQGSDSTVIFLSVANSEYVPSNESINQSVNVVKTAYSKGLDSLRKEHQQWWSNFWSLSFVTVPITKLEGFYYIMMYKFASSSRHDMHDLMGPFGPGGIDLCIGPWCQYVWDMNQQVMYWIVFASNRQEILGEPMVRAMESIKSDGSWPYFSNSPGVNENALWMWHNYWKYAVYQGNDTMLKGVLFENVKNIVDNYFIGGHLHDDGKNYHLSPCSSPEYHAKFHADCNYGLSILNWGLDLLLELSAAYSLHDPMLPKWEDVKKRLIPYPSDETGFKLDDVNDFAMPHRHFSHLLMIYDLINIAWNPATNSSLSDLIRQSLDTWYSITCNESNSFNEECRGFTQAGMSCMNALMGRPEAALGNLTALLNSVINPNGMYGEEVFAKKPSLFAPVSESAYAAAASLHEILLQSWGALLRPFPAKSSRLTDASFYRLRAAGGFLVSGVLRNGTIQFIQIESLAGWECILEIPEWEAKIPMADPSSVEVSRIPEGLLRVDLNKGETVLLYVGKEPGNLAIQPMPGNETEYNYFGYRWPVPPLH